MPEIVAFLKHGATTVTPAVLEKVVRSLPLWKASFTQIKAESYPHLVDQLMLLADAVEDFAEGAYKDMPYVTIAESIFALIYNQRKFDIIPDSIPQFGHADNSSVVRAVLIQNESAFMAYAKSQHINWSKITFQP